MPKRLSQDFIHLGLGATAVPQPPFDGMQWYAGYDQRHGDDGPEGRLVSMHTFTEPWSMCGRCTPRAPRSWSAPPAASP